MPHTGGASTHFELLTGALRDAGMLANRLVGQDARSSPIRNIFRVARAFGVRDWMRTALIHDTADLMRKAVCKSLRTSRVDLIHCHDPLATYAAINSASVQAQNIPVIQTVHGPWSREALTSGVRHDSGLYRDLRRIEGAAFSGCAHLIAVDRGQADILESDFNVAASRISVIHNATDCGRIRALSRARSPKTIPEPYFVVPRRLVPKNGVAIAIQALKFCLRENVRLAIAGDGPLAAQLRNEAAAAHVLDRVHFLGSLAQEELMPLMARSAGVIVPSVSSDGVIEATSLAVIESFACGVPVIASNIGGLADLIEHEDTGYLFPAGDARSLAGNLLRVLEMSNGCRDRLITAAWNAALRRWDVTPWFRFTIDAYCKALPKVRLVASEH